MTLEQQLDRVFGDRQAALSGLKARYPDASEVGAGANRNGWDFSLDLGDGRNLSVWVSYPDDVAYYVVADKKGITADENHIFLSDLTRYLSQI